MSDIEPIRCEVIVPVDPTRAFDYFAGALGRWWPLPFTFAGSAFRDARIEPRAGGRWYEIDDKGEETSWGLVGDYEPGERLVLAFGIGADRRPEKPGHASEVEITFTAADDGARITVEHRAFERHGESGQTLRDGMASPQGWPVILAEFAREVRQRA